MGSGSGPAALGAIPPWPPRQRAHPGQLSLDRCGLSGPTVCTMKTIIQCSQCRGHPLILRSRAACRGEGVIGWPPLTPDDDRCDVSGAHLQERTPGHSKGMGSVHLPVHLTPLLWRTDLEVALGFSLGKSRASTWAQAVHPRILGGLLALGPWATFLLSALVSPQCTGETHSSSFLNLHGCQYGSQMHLPFLRDWGLTCSRDPHRQPSLST